MNNLSSYCGLVDAKLRASDKDLPVLMVLMKMLFILRNYHGVCHVSAYPKNEQNYCPQKKPFVLKKVQTMSLFNNWKYDKQYDDT